MPALGVVVSPKGEDWAHAVGFVAGVGVDFGVRVGGEIDRDGGPWAPVPEATQEGVVVVQTAKFGSVLVVQVREVGREGRCTFRLAEIGLQGGMDLLRA